MKSIFDKTIRDTIILRIRSLSSTSKAQWGKMTVEQMVRHCFLCEQYYWGNISVRRSLLGRILGKSAISGILKDENSILRRNAPTSPQFKVTENIVDLEDEKLKWIALIKRYALFERETFTHWFFGRLTKVQLGEFIYKHCDHHLRQFGA